MGKWGGLRIIRQLKSTTAPKGIMGIKNKNGSKGARTLGLPLVRRALIPAELCFHGIHYSMKILF